MRPPEVFVRELAPHEGQRLKRAVEAIEGRLDEAVDVLRSFTKLKCRLMPYLFGAAVEAHSAGVPTMRAMLLEFPDDPGCAGLDRQSRADVQRSGKPHPCRPACGRGRDGARHLG